MPAAFDESFGKRAPQFADAVRFWIIFEEVVQLMRVVAHVVEFFPVVVVVDELVIVVANGSEVSQRADDVVAMFVGLAAGDGSKAFSVDVFQHGDAGEFADRSCVPV